MNNNHQEEDEFGGPVVSKQRRIIHFSSGETLEEEEEEEEEEKEQSSDRPFHEPVPRARFSFKHVAILVGRISLLTCDFLGERLAGALGLDAAKYQYAIDQYHRDKKTKNNQATDNLREGQAEVINLSPRKDGNHYGATGDVRCQVHSQESFDEKHMDRNEGCNNEGYQEDYLE